MMKRDATLHFKIELCQPQSPLLPSPIISPFLPPEISSPPVIIIFLPLKNTIYNSLSIPTHNGLVLAVFECI